MSNFRPFSSTFHQHTHYSLDGACSPKTLAKQAKVLGMNALAITDHGTMAGLYDAYEVCQKEGLIFIPGIEAYVKDPFTPPKTDKNGNITPGYSHMTIHFKDVWGYEYFCKLSRAAAERGVIAGGELKPLIEWSELREARGHITASCGCFDGLVQKQVRLGNLEAAEAAYCAVRELIGPEDFYAELMVHKLDSEWVRPKFEGPRIAVQGYFKDNDIDPETGKPLDRQAAPNRFVAQMARKYGDRITCGHDSHLATAEDKVIQDVRLGHMWRSSVAYKMMTPDEVFCTLQEQLGADNWTQEDMERTIEVGYQHSELFKGFKMRTPKTHGWNLPTVQTVFGEECTKTSKELLLEVIRKVGRMPTDERRPVYLERLKKELDVFTNHGIDAIPYILTACDVANHECARGNLVSLRGSGGGALVYFLVGLSPVDPIKYDLSFERHLTPDRIMESPPDADLDIGFRSLAVDYVRKKYGDKCVLISTVSLIRMKSAIGHLEDRKFGRIRPETATMCKLLPAAPQGVDDVRFLNGYEDSDGNHVPGLLEQKDEPAVQTLLKYIEDNPDIWEMAKKCMGVAQGRGVHAGGVVIANDPVHHWMPVEHSVDREIVTSYTMGYVEKSTGIKFDFLGLVALEIIGHVLRIIKETTGKDIPWEEFPHDPNVYREIIQKDKVAGIFQLSSEKALRPWVTKFPVQSIEDISNLVALVRPGSLEAPSVIPGLTNAEYFVEAANGRQKPNYVHPDLEPILKSTYSILLYQEQISAIFEKIGGLSAIDAVWAMKAVSKKNREKLEKYCGILRASCESRGWTKEQIDLLINQIMASARYSFNKSHSAAYSITPYNQCWLKYHYPLQWWCGYMTGIADKTESAQKMRDVLPECQHLIVQPDVRFSRGAEWSASGDKIVAPLILYAGIGPVTAHEVASWFSQHPVQSFDELCDALKAQKAGSAMTFDCGVLLILLYGGAMDGLIGDITVERLHECAERLRKVMKSKAGGGSKTKGIAVAMKDISDRIELETWRYEYNPCYQFDLGLLVEDRLEEFQLKRTGHPYRIYASEDFDVYSNFDIVYQNKELLDYYSDREARKEMVVIGRVVDRVSRPLKTGAQSYEVTIFTGRGTLSLRLWSKWKTMEVDELLFKKLSRGSIVFCRVRPSLYGGRQGGSIIDAWNVIKKG
jgi:DNA polymerase-3 subunit alpha